ncbi:MAG: glycosyltransferase family 39 protein [Elusimicrobiota bacterium]
MTAIHAKKILFTFALIVAGIMFFHRLNEAPLAGDDTYYSEIAKEMAVTGDFLTPHFGYRVDFHTSKPPVLFWVNAVSGKLFGFNNFAMRFPSAVLCFLGVAALLLFADRYFGRLTAFFSALILVFTQQYLYHARSAVTDGPFAVFFSLMMMSFWIARAEKRVIFYYLSGVFLGLAVMTRQIPGFFALIAVFGYIVLSKEFKILKNWHFWAGMILSAAIILPWHIAMYARHGAAFIDQYLGVALMTGIKGYPVEYSGNPSLNPWYAYFSILLSNYEPWLPFFVAGLAGTALHFKNFDAEKRKKSIFMLCWIFAPFALFQIAKVKQYHYLVPLYIPMAAVCGKVFAGFGERARKTAVLVFISVFSLYSAACIIFPIIPKTLDSREYVDTITMVPEIMKIEGSVETLHRGGMHYLSCFWFYGDKGTVINDESELISKIMSAKKRTFILFKEDYKRIADSVKNRNLNIIISSRDSVLFTN